MKEVVVLRYGHRYVRDYRVSSHCCLVARAFGAEKIVIDGEEDKKIFEGMRKIENNWGKGFSVEFTSSWRKTLKEYKKKGFTVVHLTMYGKELLKEIKGIRKCEKVVVLIGSQKVEGEVYKMSDYNISVTNQPHSEIAALAVFLDNLFEGKEMSKKFSKPKIKITPSNKGKIVKK